MRLCKIKNELDENFMTEKESDEYEASVFHFCSISQVGDQKVICNRAYEHRACLHINFGLIFDL